MPAKHGKSKLQKKQNGRRPPPEYTRWKPGQSGNPAGRRPKNLSLTSCIKEVAEWQAPKQVLANYQKLLPQLPDNATCIQILAARSFIKAMDMKSGDVMAKEIWERFDGKVAQPVTGAGGGPLELSHSLDLSDLTTEELKMLRGIGWKMRK